jgi:hypothetical protein
MRPAAIVCTRCGAAAVPANGLRPHEAVYIETHKTDGEHALFVCPSEHRMLLRTARAEDATKPSEVELATSMARAGLVR